jgi:hypothetical protein
MLWIVSTSVASPVVRLRKAAEAETDPVEKKRKLTRARNSEEKADRLRDSGTPDDDDDDEGGSGLPSHKVPTTTEGVPKPQAQRNFTDPDSRIMKRDGSYLQGYNCQIVVDGKNQIILAEAVTNQPPDQEHMVPMMQRAHRESREGSSNDLIVKVRAISQCPQRDAGTPVFSK